MDDCERRIRLERLSKEFEVHCRNDYSKRSVLFSMYILQTINIWPDNKDLPKRLFTIAFLISIAIMEYGHVSYLFINITDISKMASACTTVCTTLEGMVKMGTMLYFCGALNEILSVIFHDFWPTKITSRRHQKEIAFKSTYVVAFGWAFLLLGYVSCSQFMASPLIADTRQLPLSSWFPFDFTVSPLYELLYFWHWVNHWVIVCVLCGFDAFFNSIVMICATQFLVLQDVLENVCSENGKRQRDVLFPDEDIDEMGVLIKCVEHHLKLIRMCHLIENSMSHIIFLQFVVSTMEICISLVASIADPSLVVNMLVFLITHLIQFFTYCSVGNELTYQSEQVADAAYNCAWELSGDPRFMKSLIMLIQRAQRPEALTVAGLMQLSYTNFVAALQMAFSFYTLLDSLM